MIIALVSLALLGFFPGMASDAQKAQSKAYWASASPIAIVEMGPANYVLTGHGNASVFYIRLRNTGSSKITINKILGGDGYAGVIGTKPTMAPGEENCIGSHPIVPGLVCQSSPSTYIWIQTPSTPTDASSDVMRGADTMCDTNNRGRLLIRNFGFEYTSTIEGQALTKRQIGKSLYADCLGGVS